MKLNSSTKVEDSTPAILTQNPCCAPVLIHIRYCRWGGHPKDNKWWEGIVARAGDGLSVGDTWDYDTKDMLIKKCKQLGYEYQVLKYKRNGQIEIVQSS